MTSPIQAAPVARDPYAPASRRSAATGLMPSTCNGVDNRLVGECLGDGVNIPGNFNCAACCALRGAKYWRHTPTGQFITC